MMWHEAQGSIDLWRSSKISLILKLNWLNLLISFCETHVPKELRLSQGDRQAHEDWQIVEEGGSERLVCTVGQEEKDKGLTCLILLLHPVSLRLKSVSLVSEKKKINDLSLFVQQVVPRLVLSMLLHHLSLVPPKHSVSSTLR